jgi:hypothetical protein
MRNGLTFIALLCSLSLQAQLSGTDFDAIDSLEEATPQVNLCKKNGKEDLRFMSRVPEKYSSYKQEFADSATGAFTFTEKSHFYCDLTVEVNCEGKAGNYSFAIEPRTFGPADLENFKQLMSLVEKFRNHIFVPAVYLGEKVNSTSKFRISAKDGRPVVQ